MNILKLFSFLSVLRKGEALADPATWKNRSNLTMVLTGVFIALMEYMKAHHPDVQLPFEAADAQIVAGAIGLAVGVFFNYATSRTIGVLPPKADSNHPEAN